MPDAPHDSAPKRRRRTARRLVIAAVVFAVALGLLVLVVHLPPVRRAVLREALSRLEPYGIAVDAENLRYNLTSLSLSLDHVNVRRIDDPHALPFATIGHARADIGLRALLGGRYVVESASLEDLLIHYRVAADGSTNLPQSTARVETPTGTTTVDDAAAGYLIENATIERARVWIEDVPRDLEVDLPVERLVVEGHAASGAHDVRATAAHGSVRLASRTVAVADVEADVEAAPDAVTLRKVEGRVGASQLLLTGSVAEFERPIIDATASADIDLPEALWLAGVAEKVEGRAHIDVTARGTADTLVVSTSVNSDAVSARGLAPARVSIDGDYDATRRTATVTSARIEAPWGVLDADAAISLDDSGRSRVSGSFEQLDGQTLSSLARSRYRIASRVNGEFEAVMPGTEYASAAGDATLIFAPTIAAPSRNVVPVDGVAHVTVRGQDVDARLDHLHAFDTDVTGRVARSAMNGLSGAVALEVGAVERLVAGLERFLGRPAGSLSPVAVGGALRADARLGGTVDAPRVTAKLEAPDLSVGSLTGVALSGSADASATAVRVPGLRISWASAAAELQGRASLTGARAIEGTLSASGIGVGDVLAATGHADVPASGLLSASGVIAGTLDRPNGTFSLDGRDLVTYGEVLGTLTGRARLAGRDVIVDALTIDKPQRESTGRLDASGQLNLDSRAYAFALASEDVRLESLSLPGGTQVTAGLALRGEGKGTIADPHANVDLDVVDLVAAGKAYGDLQAKLAVDGDEATLGATASKFNTTIDGRMGIAAPHSAHVELRADRLALESLPVDLGVPLAGTVEARATFDGTADTPKDGVVEATIARTDATVNGQPVTIVGPSTLRYADRTVTIDRLEVRARGSHATLSGELPLDVRHERGALALDGVFDLSTLSAYAPPALGLVASGTLTASGTVAGTLAAIDPRIDLAVLDGRIALANLGEPVTDVQVRAEIAGGAVAVESLTAQRAGASLEAHGRAPLNAFGALPVAVPEIEAPTTLEASLRNLDPATVPGAPSGVSGAIDADLAAQSSRADITAVEGRLSFPRLEVTVADLTLAQQQPAVISAAGGVVTVESLALDGTLGRLDASGTVGLTGARPIDLRATGRLDLAALSAITDAVTARGPVTLDVRASGTVDAPVANGSIAVDEGTVVVDDPDVAVEHLGARIDLAGTRATLSRLTGLVNGGALTGSGTVTIGPNIIEEATVDVAVDDLALSAPLDLRSLSDASLTLRTRGNALVVGGRVTVQEAGLTGDINFDTGILSAIGTRDRLDLTEGRSPLLERIRFDIAVDTQNPILVDNNLAKAELTTDVRVLGTPYEPGLAGRMELVPGSSVTLNERRYEVEHGVITFADETRINPSFDLRLTTQARNYDITLGVSGEAGDTETSLSADPPLPEPDILAMLVTGRTLDEMRGEEYDIAREQVLSYLTGRLGSTLGRGIEQATGLSEVRIEPNLIANETDPGARLTVAQDLTDDLRLIYSADLVDGSDQVWVAEYDVTRRFQGRLVRQRDNTYRADIRHDLRFGGTPEPRRIPRVRPTLSEVIVTVDGDVAEADLRKRLDLETGDDYDFFAVREGVERIEKTLREQGFLQSRVRLERSLSEDGSSASLRVQVSRGPHVEIQFTGADVPGDIREQVALKWYRGIFDSQRADDAMDVLREWLVGERHLAPTVSFHVDEAVPGQRRVQFEIVPGVRFEKIVLAFDGAHGVDPDVLDDIVDEQDLEESLITDPYVVTELLRRYYREQGYLAATLAPPKIQAQGTTARIVIPVDEGPRFVVAWLTAEGNTAFSASDLLSETGLRVGEPFLPAAAETVIDRARHFYWRRGYTDVRLRFALTGDRATGQLGVTLLVDEGPQSVVASVDVQGNDRTSEAFVRSQVDLAPGDLLDVSALGRARRNLYKTGAYSVVAITRDGQREAGAGEKADEATREEGERPVTVTVDVREAQPVQLTYGGSFDTERGPGGLFEVSTTNVLGAARVFGVSGRYDSQLRQARIYASQPMLRGLPIETMASAYLRQERSPLTELTQAFNIDRIGATVQQERRFGDRYVWNYGIRYEQARQYDPRIGATGPRVTVTPLTSTITRDTRDDTLDATRGMFSSQALSYSPQWLGSDIGYIKYFGQYATYIPLQRPRRERLTNELLRPRFVFATSARLGLARASGGPLPLTERFLAGGSTSVRGFAQNAIGPIGPDGIPLGGNALVVVNNELRFPLVSIIDGVTFIDLGGVFPRISDLDWGDVRQAAGVGLRVRTRWFLLRGDYGFVLDRRTGERPGRFFFSIGQAF